MRALPVAAAAALLCRPAAGHATMTIPTGRNGGTVSEAGRNTNQACNWGTWQEGCQGAVTIDTDKQPQLLTECCNGVAGPGCTGRIDNTCDWTKNGPLGAPSHAGCAPWRAPGTANVNSPCGMQAPGCNSLRKMPDGTACSGPDGVDAPESGRAEWVAGGTADVAWAAAALHGGGYSYRLCPASSELTEECMQKMPLRFAGDSTDLVDRSGKTRYTVPRVSTTTGTHPAGSEWARVPIPALNNYWNFSSCEGQGWKPPGPDCCGYNSATTTTKWNIKDKVVVPDVAPGHYILGWRWDCEQAPQLYLNCADITIVKSGAITPHPTPTPKPTPAPPTPVTPPPPPRTPYPSAAGWVMHEGVNCFSAGKVTTTGTIVNTTLPLCERACASDPTCDVVCKIGSAPMEKFNCFLLTVAKGVDTCMIDNVFDTWSRV